ncbi:hypothetical protein P153DRAFT_369177 [Dothidotthia symphoricarpi CBS 119687]|uniref:BRCT domain-containing protein n=1 Tax=Dothidotthia symphoricarpi CBS 119687 TaxID=1392245 RepID=A0A6A6A5L2_9PLEO|nr:uncharacterized protein P153DRAFT_369177 [Dothidotthia symphoricarpi CBS 119687]KAF2126463.1 hypothetical protein P153DRAFT_369177 [Dothidotthia symphoricarpi CBS 119687]
MGATIKLDLTSDVTHLIVGNTDSAKYRYVAKSREDVKVLSPAWLGALRDVWIKGDDNVDMAALEAEYRLPTFFGLKICLTGFDNPEQRKHIQETVDKNGAEYHGDLTKSVTHLIASTPTGKKYEHALNWRMKIVSLEWFEQSLERGMVLEEALFNPTTPAEDRGKGAWDRIQITSPVLGKRMRDAEPSPALHSFRRKLRRSASTKMGSQSQALWAGITSASLEVPRDEEDDWTENVPANQSVSRAHSPTTLAGETAALHAESHPNADSTEDLSGPPSIPLGDDAHEGVFGGRIVLTHGFDEEKTKILREHLDSNGARSILSGDIDSVSSDDLRRGYLVVPHDTGADLSSLPDRARSSLNLVTNWWVERCLYGKHLVDSEEDVLSRPFDKLSVSGFSGLTVNSTGFVGIELLHVTRVVTLMGATYDEQTSRKVSVMVCSTRNPNVQKLKFATDYRIPAVHATWLWECVRTGQLQPYGDYMLNTLTPPQPQRPKQQNRPSHGDRRTVSVPEPKLQQKKAQVVKMITKSQGAQRSRALDLAPSADATPTSTTNSAIHQNDCTNSAGLFDDDAPLGGFDGAASLPLRDISANSPRRPSTSSTGSGTHLKNKASTRERSSSAESLIRATSAPRKSKAAQELTPDSVTSAPVSAIPESVVPIQQKPPPGAEEEKDYSDILAKLRANRKATPTPADQAGEKRRKRKQLGRATSTRSNPSVGDSSGNLGAEDDVEESVVVEEYQPSQELGWNSPGAAKAREQMIRKLGGTVEERNVLVKGIGEVRDVVSETGGIGGRVGRKRRG